MSDNFREEQKKKFADFLEEGSKKIDELEESVCEKHGTLIKDCENSFVCRMFNFKDEFNDPFSDFDMYAQDVNEWKWLQQFVPEVIVYSAGGACPFQAEGYLGEFNFYYRERGGSASLNLARSQKESYSAVDSLYCASIEVEEFRPAHEWLGTFLTLVEQLEKNPYLYQFQADEVVGTGKVFSKKFDENGNAIHTTAGGWGFTEEEAYQNTLEHIESMRSWFMRGHSRYDRELKKEILEPEKDWTDEDYDRYVSLRNVQPIVVKIEGEDRDYPDVDPVFEVTVPEVWRQDDGTIVFPVEDDDKS